MTEIVRPEEEPKFVPPTEEKKKKKPDLGLFYEERPPEMEPESFEEGFTLRTMLGALFVAAIMMPGSIYLSLMMGQELGPAAEWTTIILFVEVARRSFTVLRKQEIYIIYYLAGGVGAAASSFYFLIWNQYLRQSPAAKNFGIADLIPPWVAPPNGSPALIERTLLHNDWLLPIAMVVIMAILTRMQWIGMGYFLFRATSDIEKLPFPLAPVAAQGATALAEVSAEKESWRWPVFSTGTMLGLMYGLFYVAVPILTGAFLLAPQYLIPIPFADFTPDAESLFPTGRIGMATDLRLIMIGFILPFPIIAGGFIASAFSNFVFSPSLYRYGIDHGHNFFPNWKRGMNLIQTNMSTGFDLWISIGIGTALAIAVIGICKVVKGVLTSGNLKNRTGKGSFAPPVGRGDFPIPIALGIWGLATVTQVALCHFMVPAFPLWIIVLFAFLWTPLMSYVSARLIGLTGTPISIPYVNNAVFILSKYRGVDIWFAPMPLADHGWAAQRFREVELTGTKITSVLKAECFAIFVVLFFSFVYWSFYWKLSAIPGPQYPWAQTYWPLFAFNQCLWATGTMDGGANYLVQSVKPLVILSSMGGAVGLYGIMTMLGVHAMWFYGLLGGFVADFTTYLPMFIGALLGRHYMAKRFGHQRWQMYTPVLLAGYACGVGLIGMFSIGLSIIFRAVRALPY